MRKAQQQECGKPGANGSHRARKPHFADAHACRLSAGPESICSVDLSATLVEIVVAPRVRPARIVDSDHVTESNSDRHDVFIWQRACRRARVRDASGAKYDERSRFTLCAAPCKPRPTTTRVSAKPKLVALPKCQQRTARRDDRAQIKVSSNLRRVSVPRTRCGSTAYGTSGRPI